MCFDFACSRQEAHRRQRCIEHQLALCSEPCGKCRCGELANQRNHILCLPPPVAVCCSVVQHDSSNTRQFFAFDCDVPLCCQFRQSSRRDPVKKPTALVAILILSVVLKDHLELLLVEHIRPLLIEKRAYLILRLIDNGVTRSFVFLFSDVWFIGGVVVRWLPVKIWVCGHSTTRVALLLAACQLLS